MDSSRTVMNYTLEDLRDPERRAVCEESNTMKTLQKNLMNAIEETKESIELFKQINSKCSSEVFTLREALESDVCKIKPEIDLEIERLVDYFRNEMVTQNSENLKLNKQMQAVYKDCMNILLLSNEATGKFDKIESSMQLS